MNLSLSEAAKLAGVSKSALFKAMKRGVFSGIRDEVSGEWRVNITELQRVYSLKDPSSMTSEASQTDHVPTVNESAILSERVRALEESITQLKDERDYLRVRLDAESEERKRLTLVLTGTRTNADLSATPQRIPWMWIILAILLASAGIALNSRFG